jgi:hypothetical protein
MTKHIVYIFFNDGIFLLIIYTNIGLNVRWEYVLSVRKYWSDVIQSNFLMRTKLDIYVFITITGSIPLLVDY